MKNIYFIINNNGNHQNIINSGSGASEFLFYLTAYKLSSYCNITIFNRDIPTTLDSIEYKYLPNNLNPSIENINNSVIIVQRHFTILIDLHKSNPSNKYILWSHDFLENNFTHLAGNYSPLEINDYFYKNNITIVSVSNFHKNNIQSILPDVNIVCIYNALFSEHFLKNENIVSNKNNIIFASNWGKGIDRVLNIGTEYSKINPNFKLLLLKPSYCEWEPDLNKFPFVQMIGSVKNKNEYCEILQGCLCVLTTSYPETFGCVFAEALHLGVPVIGDTSIGAGFHEIISSEYMCNFNNMIEVINIINNLQINRPNITLDSKFYIDSIILEWIKLMD